MSEESFKDKFKESILDEKHYLNETTFEIHSKDVKKALRYLKETEGFRVLMDLTGVDYLEPVKRTKIVYQLHQPDTFDRLRITTWAGRDDKVESVVDLWEGADWYERELFDLFGVNFEGHPEMKRILMPDDWEGHPLRKDYALTEESVQFKHNVKPKVPSEIIPHVK